MDSLVLIPIFLPLLLIAGIAGIGLMSDNLRAKGMNEDEVIDEICRRLSFRK